MSNELRPCPFCGGEDTEIAPGIRNDWLVGCLTCDYGIRCSDCSEEEVISFWNTRPAEDALQAEIERMKSDLEIQKNLTRQACFESNRAYSEVEKWEKMFYNLVEKQASVSTDPKVLVIGKDTNTGSAEESR